MVTARLFGFLQDKRPVTCYRMENSYGEYAEFLDYGASVHAVCVRNREGKLTDVCLGADGAQSLEGPNHEGVTIGRVANRIDRGRCTVFGRQLQLECNWKGNFMHGASGNYARRFFKAIPFPEENRLQFLLEDAGEGGFGNHVEVCVEFSFGDDRSLRIHYRMTPREDTLLCPTNHVYFDLSEKGDVLNHTLQLRSDSWAVKGSSGMPEGETAAVRGTAFDFTKEKKLGEALSAAEQSCFRTEPPYQIDDTFLLTKGDGWKASLYYPENGIRVWVYTDMPAVVVFTPIAGQIRTGKHGRYYMGYCGVALETQYVPNAVNCAAFEKPVFAGGETLDSVTRYEFAAV